MQTQWGSEIRPFEMKRFEVFAEVCLLALYLIGTPSLQTSTSPPSCLHLGNRLFIFVVTKHLVQSPFLFVLRHNCKDTFTIIVLQSLERTDNLSVGLSNPFSVFFHSIKLLFKGSLNLFDISYHRFGPKHGGSDGRVGGCES